MGSLCGSGNNTTTTTNASSTTPTNSAGVADVFSRVQSAASNPYTPYGGELTAPINSQQQQGISNINASAGRAQPYYDTAAGYAATSGAPIDPSQIARYTNPYTQSVINATQANFNESNGQQQQQIKGNAALAGALGGDRQGVAQAETARLQKLAQDPVIAGLNQQNYTQALQAAQADRSAAGSAAGTFGNIGTTAQTAGLQGAQAQIGAGTLEQGTQQARDTAQYQQYLQAQGFPYQQAQFYAQYGLPAATAQGSSTSGTGTSTPPPPNQLAQIAGLGISAAGLFLKDGGAVHGFASGGSPYSFISDAPGFIPVGGAAPQVTMPHAAAPSMSMSGPGGGTQANPWSAVTTGLSGMRGRFGGSSATPDYGQDTNTMVGGYSMPTFGTQGGGSYSSPLPGLSSGDYDMPGADVFKSGGLVEAIHSIHRAIKHSRGGAVGGSSPFQAFADGGATFNERFSGETKSSPWDHFKAGAQDFAEDARKMVSGDRSGTTMTNRRALWDNDKRNGYADGGPTFDDRFSAAFSPRETPPAEESPFRLSSPEAIDAWRKGVDTPNPAVVADAEVPPIAPRAPAAPANPMRAALPPQITGPEQEEEPSSAMAYDSTGRSPMTLASQAAESPPQQQFGKSLFGANISDKTRQALVAAGLGMMASKSPFALSAIGEGGLHGLKSYSDSTTAEREAADKKISQGQQERRVNMEAQRLVQGAEQFAKTNSLAERKFKADQEKTKYVPAGSIMGADGTLRPAVMEQSTGRIIDAVTGKQASETDKVVAKGSKAPVSDEDAKALAEYYVKTGDASRLNGMGITGEARQKVQHYVTQTQKEKNVSDEELATRKAEWEGRKAGQRVLATQEAKMGSAAMEAEGAIKLTRGIIEKLPRTSFLPMNQLIQGYQNKTLNPDQAELYARAQAIVNTYSAVMARGANITTDASRHKAESLLNTANNPEVFNRVLDTLLNEIDMAKHSPARMREFYRQQYGEKAVATGDKPDTPAATASPPATAVPAAPKGVPAGSAYSPSRKQWKGPDGTLYNADGSKA